MKFFKLNNDIHLPAIGLGAGIIPKDNEDGTNPAADKQKTIYQYCIDNYDKLLYDTSSSYGLNEAVLGQVIAQTPTARKKMFLSVKISNAEQRAGDIKAAFQKHLDTLNTDYVDMLLLHWPHPGTYVDSYKQMEELYAEGKVKALGVSNFHQHHLGYLMNNTTIVPAVNQIEVHPLFTQIPLITFCREHGIRVMAYTPLGRMHDVLIKSKTLREMAKKYKKTVPQIILRWDYQRGLASIPRTSTPAHFEEFMEIFNFEMTPEEIQEINRVNENIRLRFNPDTVDYRIV